MKFRVIDAFQLMKLDGTKNKFTLNFVNSTERKSVFNEMMKLIEAFLQNGGSLKVTEPRYFFTEQTNGATESVLGT